MSNLFVICVSLQEAAVQAQAVRVTLAVCRTESALNRRTSRHEMLTLLKSRWNYLSLACSCAVHFSVCLVYLLTV